MITVTGLVTDKTIEFIEDMIFLQLCNVKLLGKGYKAVRVAVNTNCMSTNYLNNSVMNSLHSLSERLGTPNPSVGNISTWECGGACEGLSTPLA